MCCHFVRLKSVIFLKYNLEAILSNFIPVIISSHTAYTTTSYILSNSLHGKTSYMLTAVHVAAFLWHNKLEKP